MLTSSIPNISIDNISYPKSTRDADLNALTEINQKVGWKKYNYRILDQARHKNPSLLVARIHELIVGYVMGFSNIAFIAVHPEHQRKGVGAQLVLKVIEIAREKSLPSVTLQFRSNQEHLKKFYTEKIPRLAECAYEIKQSGSYSNGDPSSRVKYLLS